MWTILGSQELRPTIDWKRDNLLKIENQRTHTDHKWERFGEGNL